MTNPFSGSVRPAHVAKMLRSPGELAGMLKEELPGADATPAEILADIVNVERADAKQICDAVGAVDPETGEPVSIQPMTEDRAAELVAGVTQGDGLELVEVFNEIARKRDLALRELLDEGEHEQFMAEKTAGMHTDDPDTWQEDPVTGGD